MKKTILLTTFIAITSSAIANTNIHLPSQILPEGMSEERFAQLQEEFKRHVDKENHQKSIVPRASTSQEAKINKKVASKSIASSVKREFIKQFEKKIHEVWKQPPDSAGKKAIARITLSDNGSVQSIVVTSSDANMKESIETAIRAAAPYPLPSDPDARKDARSFIITMIAR